MSFFGLNLESLISALWGAHFCWAASLKLPWLKNIHRKLLGLHGLL
jgi:hypothetical protein